MNVYVYWEGPRVPYIDRCIDSIRQRCYRGCTFHFITGENIDQYIPDGMFHPRWKQIPELGVKSDVVRAAVLHRFGGLYVDADTVMLRSPVGVIDESKDCAYMEWTTPPQRCIAGYIYCRPGSPVAKMWVDNINAALARRRVGWTQLGEGCLTPAINATPPENLQRLPLNTFLPIEIDIEVAKFFEGGDWPSLTTPDTIAFGLNHSWMTSRRPREMHLPPERMARSPMLIHQILTHGWRNLKPPKITACCCTYRRPELLARLIHSFEQQDYPNREMVILDDSGELEETTGDRWRIISTPIRFPTLGAKRNRLAAIVADQTDAIVPWDDDDIAAPWAMSAIAQGLYRADLVRPSEVLIAGHGGRMERHQTFWRADKLDKAFHPAWGFTVGAFLKAGGYPADVSHGEDLCLARRFREAGVSECDPIALGHDPYYVYAPWKNEHFGWTHKNYETWSDKLKAKPATVTPVPHGLSLSRDNIAPEVHARSFAGDWYESDTR